jgi:small subunit ribosomal protein S21
VQVIVRDNDVAKALKELKRKLQQAGVFRVMKAKAFYEKPSTRKARERREAMSRERKRQRKQVERDGF